MKTMDVMLAVAIEIAAFCVVTAALASESAPKLKPILYTNDKRTSYERFVQDDKDKSKVWWEGGNFAPKHRSTPRQQDFFYDEYTSAPLNDCSDEKFRCVYGIYRVFALPRQGLGSSSAYSVGGADFHVEKCIRGGEERCKVALIRSECQSKVEPDRCVAVTGGRANSPSPGPIVYFLFSEDVGITAYGSVDEPADAERVPLTVAQKMLLRSSKGLLGSGSVAPVR
jgi:hypothetical protein